MAKNETRYRQAMQMIRDGKPNNVITELTGLSQAVIEAMAKDIDMNHMERRNND